MFKDKNIIGVIPARYNSSRFLGKLLEEIFEKSVLQRTFEMAKRSKYLSKLFIATDHEKIANHASKFCENIILTCPSCINGTFRIIEAMDKENEIFSSDIIVNIQGDHPCISPSSLDKVIIQLLNDENAEIATACSRITEKQDFLSPNVVKCVFDNNYNALYFSRSPIPYCKDFLKINAFHHYGIYAYKTSFLKILKNLKTSPLQEIEDLEQLNFLEHGYKIKIALVDEIIPSVDVPEDIKKVEKYLCQ